MPSSFSSLVSLLRLAGLAGAIYRALRRGLAHKTLSFVLVPYESRTLVEKNAILSTFANESEPQSRRGRRVRTAKQRHFIRNHDGKWGWLVGYEEGQRRLCSSTRKMASPTGIGGSNVRFNRLLMMLCSCDLSFDLTKRKEGTRRDGSKVPNVLTKWAAQDGATWRRHRRQDRHVYTNQSSLQINISSYWRPILWAHSAPLTHIEVMERRNSLLLTSFDKNLQ